MMKETLSVPICSMYDIFTYIWLVFMANVGRYTNTIHGSYGVYKRFKGIFLGHSNSDILDRNHYESGKYM